MITEYAKAAPGTVALNARAYDRYKRYSFDFDQKNFKLDFTNGVLIYKSIKGARANPQSQDFMTRKPNVTIWDGVTEAPDETARGDWMKLVANAGLQWDKAILDYLVQGRHEVERKVEPFWNGVSLTMNRPRPPKPAKADGGEERPTAGGQVGQVGRRRHLTVVEREGDEHVHLILADLAVGDAHCCSLIHRLDVADGLVARASPAGSHLRSWLRRGADFRYLGDAHVTLLRRAGAMTRPRPDSPEALRQQPRSASQALDLTRSRAMRIDINSDIGESFGAYTIGHDAGLMRRSRRPTSPPDFTPAIRRCCARRFGSRRRTASRSARIRGFPISSASAAAS